MITQNNSTKRCFLAISLDEVCQQNINNIIKKLQNEFPKKDYSIRWIALNKLHLTLKFFESISTESISDLIRSISEKIKTIPKFQLIIKKISLFPSSKPRLFALEIESNNDLIKLVTLIEDTAETVGFPKEKRFFHAHITLGRFHSHKIPSSFITSIEHPITLIANEIILFESQFFEEKEVMYIPLHHFLLA